MTGGELSQGTIDVLKATAPVVSEHKNRIAARFYEILMTDYPVVKNYFNMSHFRNLDGNGSPQAQAVGNAVAAYAANCDNLGVLTAAVENITEKHVSFDINPDHYSVVGSCLLKAIKDVLGDAATDDIIEAWGDGYNFLADLFISIEKDKVEKKASQEGGWRGFKKLVVSRREKESDLVTSFYFRAPDGETGLPDDFKAGQYLSIRLPKGMEGIVGVDHAVVRNYSLSCGPNQGEYRVSIKREEGDGSGERPQGLVSNYFYNHVHEGSTVEIGMPCGSFCLGPDINDETPLALISAGVGVTPMMSMLESLKARTGPVVFVQVCKSANEHPFRQVVDNLLVKLGDNATGHAFYSATSIGGVIEPAGEERLQIHNQRLDEASLVEILPQPMKDTVYYFCGPKRFQEFIGETLDSHDVPKSSQHYECFSPTL